MTDLEVERNAVSELYGQTLISDMGAIGIGSANVNVSIIMPKGTMVIQSAG